MTRRFICCLLCVCLLTASVSTTVFAQEETEDSGAALPQESTVSDAAPITEEGGYLPIAEEAGDIEVPLEPSLPTYEQGSGTDLELPVEGFAAEDLDPWEAEVTVDEEFPLRYVEDFEYIEELPEGEERTAYNSGYYTTNAPTDDNPPSGDSGLIITIWHKFLDFLGVGKHSVNVEEEDEPVTQLPFEVKEADSGDDDVPAKPPQLEPPIMNNDAPTPVADEDDGWVYRDYGNVTCFSMGTIDVYVRVTSLAYEDGTPYNAQIGIEKIGVKRDGDRWLIKIIAAQGKDLVANISFAVVDRTDRANPEYNDYNDSVGIISDVNAYAEVCADWLATPLAGNSVQILTTDMSTARIYLSDIGIRTAVGEQSGEGLTFSAVPVTVNQETSLRIVDGSRASSAVRDGQLTLAWSTAEGSAPAQFKIENGRFVSVIPGGTAELTPEQSALLRQGLVTATVYDSEGVPLASAAEMPDLWASMIE